MNAARFRACGYAGVFLLCALLYGSALSYPFLFDDHIYLLENPLVTQARSFHFPFEFQAFATRSYHLALDPDLSVNFILRPVTYATFYLNHALDGWNPRGFRAVNVLIHALNGVLIFELLWLLVRRSSREMAEREDAARFIALAAALLFVVHPLATESVTYIVQRFTSLATLFYLAVLYAYFRSSMAESPRVNRAWRVGSVALLLVGMLSKEFLFTAPFLILFLEYVLMGTPLKEALQRTIPHLFCLPLIPVLMVLTSAALQRGGVNMESAMFVATPTQSATYQYDYALTETRVVLTYLRMIFLPFGLNLDPSVPLSKSLLDLPVLGSILVIAALLGGSALWWWRDRQSLQRALLFTGIFWFFFGLSIDSTIVPLPDVMAEHRSYMPSIGIFLVLAVGLDTLRRRVAAERSIAWLTPALTGVWVLALCATTTFRHRAWSSEVAMWQDCADKSPRKSRVWMNLGASYVRAHKPAEAHDAFMRFQRLDPNQLAGYINLATVEADMGQFHRALQTAQKGARLLNSPHDHQYYYVLGRIWLALGDVRRSIACAEKVVELAPRHAQAHRILMTLYTQSADYKNALKHARVAAGLQPDDPRIGADVRLLERAVTETAQR